VLPSVTEATYIPTCIIMTAFDGESAAPVWVQKFMCIDQGSAGSKLLSIDTKCKSVEDKH